MDGVIVGKTCAQIPDRDGNFSARPSGENIVIFLLGARSNHALGMFAPGFKQLGDYFRDLSVAQSEGAADNGCKSKPRFVSRSLEVRLMLNCPHFAVLGQSSWSNADSNSTPEFLSISYWRSIEELHAFAQSPLHREAWAWWNRTLKEHDFIAIYHEVYAVDSQKWESIYINCQPTGLGATSYLKKGDKLVTGVVADEWISPVVDASKGKLRTMLGRINRRTGSEHENYGKNPYEA
jgi:hypothetical protein